jgi:ABC-type uncharacterized transport system substrate-binding protein
MTSSRLGDREAPPWRGFFVAVVVGLAALAPAAPARAHPNVWIRCRVAFVFAGGKIARIAESWTFDKKFSAELMRDFDKNRDGQIDARESRAVAQHTLPNLKDYRYFTYVWVGGQDLGTLAPTRFVATAAKGQVTFTFAIVLPKPVDPRHRALKLEVYDRSYFAQVDFAKQEPVHFRGAKGLACTYDMRPDKQHPYFGYIYPPAITPSCK